MAPFLNFVKRPAEVGGGFTPSAQLAWFKADLLTGSDGDRKATMPDSTGNGWDGTAPASRLAALRTGGNGLNGMNVLEFSQDSGNNVWYNFGNMYSGATAASLYLVMRAFEDPTATGTPTGLFVFGSGAGEHCPFTDGNVYAGFGALNRHNTGNPTPNLASQYRIVSFHSVNGSWHMYIDGVLHFSTATNTFSMVTAPIFGQSLAGAAFFRGRLAEALWKTTFDDATERDGCWNMLADKWGLTI